MSILTTRAETDLYFKDFGSGQPIVFVHGWPLNGDAWDGQMVFMQDNGFRVIAHDRRDHGRSSAHGDGNDMETYAADLNDLMDHLDLKDAVLVGHSTGGGEVAYYLGTYGSARVAKAVLLGAVPPLMLKTDDNPDGVPKDVFDGIWKSTFDDRSQFFLDFPEVFYGFNRPGAKRSEGLKHAFWLQGMMANQKSLLDCVAAFSATDFRELLPRIDIPVLVAHGDADQVVPFAISAAKTSKLIPNATLKVYPGAPHGLASTLQDQFNADLLSFVKG